LVLIALVVLLLIFLYRQSQNPSLPVYEPYTVDFYSQSGDTQSKYGRSIPSPDWTLEPEKHVEND
jgi:hypothetical protein